MRRGLVQYAFRAGVGPQKLTFRWGNCFLLCWDPPLHLPVWWVFTPLHGFALSFWKIPVYFHEAVHFCDQNPTLSFPVPAWDCSCPELQPSSARFWPPFPPSLRSSRPDPISNSPRAASCWSYPWKRSPGSSSGRCLCGWAAWWRAVSLSSSPGVALRS